MPKHSSKNQVIEKEQCSAKQYLYINLNSSKTLTAIPIFISRDGLYYLFHEYFSSSSITKPVKCTTMLSFWNCYGFY